MIEHRIPLPSFATTFLRVLGPALVAYGNVRGRARVVSGLARLVDEGDVDAQRFYERQGFSGVEPTTGERAFYYFRELDPG